MHELALEGALSPPRLPDRESLRAAWFKLFEEVERYEKEDCQEVEVEAPPAPRKPAADIAGLLREGIGPRECSQWAGEHALFLGPWEAFRRFECSYYEDCLDYVAREGWRGFTCRGCGKP